MRVIVIAVMCCVAGCILTGCVETMADDSPASAHGSISPPGATGASSPAVRREVIGASVLGRSIEIAYFGDGGGTPAVLILGGIHGDEVGSVDCTRGLIALLRAEPNLASGRTVAIIEIANPDGYARRTRANANGIDCNRNFPARNFKPGGSRAHRAGTQPASEPETRAILSAIAQLRPKLIVSIHSIGGGKQQNNYDGPGEVIARLMAEKNGYPVTASIGYPTPGSLGSYAGGDLQIPIITLELPRDQLGPAAWRHNREALLTAVRW